MFTPLKNGWTVTVPMENLLPVTSNGTRCNQLTPIAEERGLQVHVHLYCGIYIRGSHGEQSDVPRIFS